MPFRLHAHGVYLNRLSFVKAPAIAGGFAAVVYLLTKYGVLLRKNALRAGFISAPIFFFVVTAVLTMVISTSNESCLYP